MKKIIVSHEAPLSLMDYVKSYNDYDYCLPHLLDNSSEYRDFFFKQKKGGRYIMMDNSLHELGESYDRKRLIYWIKKLRPNEFFIPDVWEDRNNTIIKAREWTSIKIFKNINRTAIIQGKDLEDILTCIESFRKMGYERMAFSYGASLYNEICPHPNKDLGKALGRLKLICFLYNRKTLNQYDKIHLLGVSVPQELSWYKGIPCVKSVDTSNPVMACLDKIQYTGAGLFEKPKADMNNSFNISLEDVDMGLLEYNLKQFKKINDL